MDFLSGERGQKVWTEMRRKKLSVGANGGERNLFNLIRMREPSDQLKHMECVACRSHHGLLCSSKLYNHHHLTVIRTLHLIHNQINLMMENQVRRSSDPSVMGFEESLIRRMSTAGSDELIPPSVRRPDSLLRAFKRRERIPLISFSP